MEAFIVGVVYGEWVEKESGWEWYAKGNVTTPLLLTTNTTYDQFIDEIIKKSGLNCDQPTHVHVKYIITSAPSNEKVHPTEIKSDEDLMMYKSDVGCGGCRPILKVSISHVEKDNSHVEEDNQFELTKNCSPNENTLFDFDFNGDNETMDVDENIELEELNEEQHAKDFVRGTPEHGYAVLEAYRHILELTNQGTKTDLEVDKENRFLYFFVAFGPCIRGFALMKKVVALDGCFLTGKFGGTMLVATAQDGENHLYPIAWAVVNSENDKSWGWFLEHLQDIVPDSDKLCIISDRNQSIKNSIAKVYPMAHHGYCMRHLGENLWTKFRCGQIIRPYYSAAQAYTLKEFHEHFREIRRLNSEAADYLQHDVGFYRWTRAHSPANRFNVMTTNIAEFINARIKVEREFPIIALFDAIQRILSTWFYERRMQMVDCTTILVPSKESRLRKNLGLSEVLVASPINVHEFIVRGGSEDAVVDLNRKECSCREFNVDKIPCSHALAAIREQKLPDFGRRIYTFCSPTYKTKSFLHAYVENIYPTPAEEQWEVPESVASIIIYPPKIKVSKGRKRVNRIPSAGEGSNKKNKCSKCK